MHILVGVALIIIAIHNGAFSGEASPPSTMLAEVTWAEFINLSYIMVALILILCGGKKRN